MARKISTMRRTAIAASLFSSTIRNYRYPHYPKLMRFLPSSLLSVLFTMAPLTYSTAVTALSTPTTTGTTQNAKIMAQNFEAFQLAKLKEAGLLGVKRPYTIVAEAVDLSPNDGIDDEDIMNNCIATKVIHFQRHGQGYHNLIGEMYRELLGTPINLDDKNPSTNPFLRPEMTDSPLTEKGRLECAARRSQASLLNPQVIVVSPLHRAIQTAQLSFADHMSATDANGKGDTGGGIPWIAHEGAREQLGLLQCNKRRALSETRLEFPLVDFSEMMQGGDEDTLWKPEERESPQEETERIYKFLTEFLMNRPEQEMALVGHSAWLFTMCNAVVECGDNPQLRCLFQTSEIRTMKLSFYKTKDATALHSNE